MSTTRKSAVPEPEAHRLRRWVFPAGAGLGWALALLAGTLLAGELQALRFLFLPLSTLAGGAAALGAWTHFADTVREEVRRRRLRAALAVLALGTILLLGLYLGFARRISYEGRTRSVAFLVGLSRSGLCECSSEDAECFKEMGLDVGAFRSCWKGRWVVDLALALSYLLTLGSAGTAVGLLMIPARLPQPPQTPQYLDFDIWINQSEGKYCANARSDGAGFDATEYFALPAALADGDLCLARGGVRRGGPGAAEAAEGASPDHVKGELLFRTVFQGKLLEAFKGCLATAEDGPGVRIRLRLNEVPHLAGLPWEYLHDGRSFLAFSDRTPVVRYLELCKRLGTLQVEPPLRVLTVISTPKGYPKLAQAEEEWRRLGVALEPLLKSGRIEVEQLERPTYAALAARLRKDKPVHVFHFVGHGGFSEQRRKGVLVFENEEGKADCVEGSSLANLFQDHTSLRLAVLNACEGARTSSENIFAGTAQVVGEHVPAVIAMRLKIFDETACSFAEEFYRALADGLPVEACVGEARKALEAKGNLEWGTPVLYLRATDGRLFDFEGGDDTISGAR